MDNVMVLNIVFAASPKESCNDVYVYGNDGFIEKLNNGNEINLLGEKYKVEEEYTWYFKNFERMQNFLDDVLEEYYGKLKLQTLSGYLVRTLNYIHTGISMRSFMKGMIYIGVDDKEYICLEGSTIYDSKWIQAEALKEYRVNSFENEKSMFPEETAYKVVDWLHLKTDIVNIVTKADLPTYKIEDDRVIFK